MANNFDLNKEAADLLKEVPGLSQEDTARLLIIVHKLLEGFNCEEDPKECLEKMKSSINYGIKVSDNINHDNILNVKDNLNNLHKVITHETISQDEEAVKKAVGATVASIILLVKDLGHDINFTKLALDIATCNIISIVDDLEHVNLPELAKDMSTTLAFGKIAVSNIVTLLEDSGERFHNFFSKEIKPTFKSIGTKLGHNEGFEKLMHKLHHAFHHKSHHDNNKHDGGHNSVTDSPPAEHTVLVEEHTTVVAHVEV